MISVISTLAQSNNKAIKKSTLYMENGTHLRARFDRELSSWFLLYICLTDKGNSTWPALSPFHELGTLLWISHITLILNNNPKRYALHLSSHFTDKVTKARSIFPEITPMIGNRWVSNPGLFTFQTKHTSSSNPDCML